MRPERDVQSEHDRLAERVKTTVDGRERAMQETKLDLLCWVLQHPYCDQPAAPEHRRPR